MRLSSADVGSFVMATVAAGSGSLVTSANASEVGPVGKPAPPRLRTAPHLSGDAKVGAVLTTSTGSWTSPDVLTFRFIWELCSKRGRHCHTINGTTAATTVSSSPIAITTSPRWSPPSTARSRRPPPAPSSSGPCADAAPDLSVGPSPSSGRRATRRVPGRPARSLKRPGGGAATAWRRRYVRGGTLLPMPSRSSRLPVPASRGSDHPITATAAVREGE